MSYWRGSNPAGGGASGTIDKTINLWFRNTPLSLQMEGMIGRWKMAQI
ncbi:MAG: hypothetical protein ACLRTA_05110 [Clostridia bacterium]